VTRSDRPGLARIAPPATSEERLEQLHAEIDRLVRAELPAECESRAGRIYRVGFEASGMSGHEFARTIKRNERMHRMYARGVEASATLECILRMPRRSQIAILRELASIVRESSDEAEENSARGAA
jgi:hypothetical protein